jgi:hypothetical protein
MGKIDIAFSESGKNAHYHHCSVKDQRCNYAACLNTIKKSKNGTLKPQSDRANCDQTIKMGECPAVAMRKEEVVAKEALYYIPREKPESSYLKGWEIVKNNGVRNGISKGELHTVEAGESKGKSFTSTSTFTSAPSKRSATAKPVKSQDQKHADNMNIDVSKVINTVAKETTPETKSETKPKSDSAADALALMMGK